MEKYIINEKFISYVCENLEEAKAILLEFKPTEKKDISSSIKTYATLDYSINIESQFRGDNILTIKYVCDGVLMYIEFNAKLIHESGLYKETFRGIDMSAESHYLCGRRGYKNIRIPFYKWVGESVTMSHKYDYIINEDFMNRVITFITK